MTPKSELLKQWMASQGIFRTHQVLAWGLENYYNRANRTKGQFHHDGIIRRLEPEEVTLRGLPKSQEDYYIWVGEPVREPSGQLCFV